jgi:hypothetical protein
VLGRRGRPDMRSGDYGEVRERQCPRQLSEGECLQSRGGAGERFEDPIASHDQMELIEVDRDPSLPFTSERT